MSIEELTQRLTRIEDINAIRELVARYGFAVDDRDIEGITRLFSEDGCLRTANGRIKGKGVAEVAQYFASHLPTLGPTHHFTHDHVVEFDQSDPRRATGVVSAHAEVWRDGAPMLTAMRYLDEYVKRDGIWRFRSRTQSYMYFVDVRQYPETLGHRLRVRLSQAEADWKPGDWPLGVTVEG